MKTLLIILLLTGCTPPAPFVYETKCITIESDLELIEERVKGYTDKAEELFEAKFGPGKFCDVVKSASFRVLDVGLFDCSTGTKKVNCIGYVDTTGQVTLQRYGYALLHEILHIKDQQVLDISTIWHTDWEAKGYIELDDKFMLWSTASENVWSFYNDP